MIISFVFIFRILSTGKKTIISYVLAKHTQQNKNRKNFAYQYIILKNKLPRVASGCLHLSAPQ